MIGRRRISYRSRDRQPDGGWGHFKPSRSVHPRRRNAVAFTNSSSVSIRLGLLPSPTASTPKACEEAPLLSDYLTDPTLTDWGNSMIESGEFRRSPSAADAPDSPAVWAERKGESIGGAPTFVPHRQGDARWRCDNEHREWRAFFI